MELMLSSCNCHDMRLKRGGGVIGFEGQVSLMAIPTNQMRNQGELHVVTCASFPAYQKSGYSLECSLSMP